MSERPYFNTVCPDIKNDKEIDVCHWYLESQDTEEGAWSTSCENTFVIIDGTPTDNDMKFCCYCGCTLTHD